MAVGFESAVLALRLDREALRLATLLEVAGVESLLLKGPVLQRWLYPDFTRHYGDIDLLVSPDQQRRAIGLLADQGYYDPMPGAVGLETSAHARALAHADGCVVDLHTRLSGITVADNVAWDALRSESGFLNLAGGTVRVCGPVGQLLVVVLHAAQHGIDEPKPLEDLRRAAHLVDATAVRAAAEMATALGAAESFAAGLRLESLLAGLTPELASAPQTLLVRARLASRHGVPGVALLVALMGSPWRVQLRLATRAVWPTGDLLRAMTPPKAQQQPGWLFRARARILARRLKALPRAVREIRNLTPDR